MSSESEIKTTAETVKGIVEAVPVYQDGLQPAVQELGKGLQTVAKCVHVALAPVSALVWGYDQVKEFVSTRVAEKLKSIPPERIVPPPPNVAGPALEALKYTGYEDQLRDLYAQLLATAMDQSTSSNAHPAFVDMIKSMSPDEARIMRWMSSNQACAQLQVRWEKKGQNGFLVVAKNVTTLGEDAGLKISHLTPHYIDNLCRLGLLQVPDYRFAGEEPYKRVEESAPILALKKSLGGPEIGKIELKREKVEVTELGKLFVQACIYDKVG